MLGGGDLSYGLVVFHFSYEEVKRAVVLSFRFCFLHSSHSMRLFVPRNKQPMITKENKTKKGPRDGIFMQPCKYFAILKILQYDYALLSLHTLVLYDRLRSKNPETIVIVSTGRPNIALL